MMEEKKLVPKKRFKGYDKHWSLFKFDTKFNIVSGNAFKLSEYVSSGVPIINGESIQNGFIKSNNLHYLPKTYLERYDSIKLLKGDIVLGLNRPIINNKLKISLVPYTLNESLLYQRAGKIINVKNIHQYFSYRLLEKHIYQFVLKEAVGSDQPFISTNILKETSIIIPVEEKEQQKIGEFFKVLDERIANQERKIAKVKALKEAYLTEMFPQEGETVPKRRFKGFEEKWKKYYLKDLGTFTSNGVDKKVNINEKKVNLLNYMDVYNRREITNKNVKELMEVTAKENQIINNNILKNDVFFTPTSETPEDIGRVMVIEETLENTVYSYHLMRFRPIESAFYSLFPNYVFDTSGFRKQLIYEAQGVQRYVLNRDAFENLHVLLPSYKEQQKIGTFFKNLDDQIRAEEAKLEKLKKMKEAYLEEMFV